MTAPEARLSVSRQCVMLGVARSSFYYRPRPARAEELDVLKRLDRIFTDHPVYGSRRPQVALWREGVSLGRRRVPRLMRKLGLWAVRPDAQHQQAASRAPGLPIRLRSAYCCSRIASRTQSSFKSTLKRIILSAK
jgi:putative transposase